MDVWFDSGSTHAFVLEQRSDLKWPASLYLEGSDQHRGWFQSSLLEGCGTRGRAPFDEVLTHGFVNDEDGRKMSKSLGNVVSPQDVIRQSGAEILRLWAMSSDYADDLRIGPDIIKANVDSYRRLRNTLRFLLGNLAHYRDDLTVGYEEMPELERYMLARIAELDALVREGYIVYDFKRVFHALLNFCVNDLSASIWISARTRSIAIRMTASRAARRSPSWTGSSPPSRPGSRPCCASPWKKPG
nr:class I tRNA ligase family protein [Methyloceanibacter methanicus]